MLNEHLQVRKKYIGMLEIEVSRFKEIIKTYRSLALSLSRVLFSNYTGECDSLNLKNQKKENLNLMRKKK